jgi:hypothetical protein
MRRIFLWGLALLVVVAVVVGVVYKRNSGPEGRTEAATATWHPNKTAFCAAWNNAPDHSFTKKALSAAQSLALYEYLAVNAPNKMAYTAYRTAALAFVPLMSDPVGLAYEQNGTLGYIGVARGEKVDATTTAFIHAMKAVLNQGNEGC